MSIASAHAAQFYREVAQSGLVWSIMDPGGFPAPVGSDGRRAMPFWSSQSRATVVISSVETYKGFTPDSIDWNTFCEHWVPGLTRDGLLVGINWSGVAASGFDIEPAEMRKNVEAVRHVLPPNK